jgi:hypothetical protein
MTYDKNIEERVKNLLKEVPLPMGDNQRINNLMKAVKRGTASDAHKGELNTLVNNYQNAPRCQGLG